MSLLTAFFRLIRFVNLVIIAIGLSVFYYLILVPVHNNSLGHGFVPFTDMQFALFVLSVVLIAAAGNIINDYFDFELDREYKPERPLAKGIISLNAAIYIHILFAFLGIAIGFYLGWKAGNLKLGYFYIISLLLLHVYSAYLKKVPLVGNIVVAGLSAFVFVLLLLFEATYFKFNPFEASGYVLNILLWQVRFYAGFAFLTSLAREIIKDIEDREGDAAHQMNTLPVWLGDNVAKYTALFVLLVIVAALIFISNGFIQVQATKEAVYLVGAVAVPLLAEMWLLFTAKTKGQYARAGFLLKLIMLLGICSIPAFYIFNQTT